MSSELPRSNEALVFAAGCHQSCQDQMKRLSLHEKQMLPRHRCSMLAEKTDWRIRSTGHRERIFAHSGDHPVVVILRPLTVATTDGRGARRPLFARADVPRY